MSQSDFDDARELVNESFGIGSTPRAGWISKVCVPNNVKGGTARVLVLALVLWTGVLFYHGWNEGSFMYNDAGTAINVDCKRGAESSLAQEMCKRAKLHRGVHPLVFAAEYTLLGLQRACIDTFLAVMGSSLLMISVFAFVAFCTALWYVSPSRRETHCHLPSIWEGCLPKGQFHLPCKGVDQILSTSFPENPGIPGIPGISFPENHNKIE
jgi:hypothetical protein